MKKVKAIYVGDKYPDYYGLFIDVCEHENCSKIVFFGNKKLDNVNREDYKFYGEEFILKPNPYDLTLSVNLIFKYGYFFNGHNPHMPIGDE